MPHRSGGESPFSWDVAQEKIDKLYSGEMPISEYLRPGFEFLTELMDKAYFHGVCLRRRLADGSKVTDCMGNSGS